MTKQDRYNRMWMDVARVFAHQSHCTRRQVGCVIVKGDRIISQGWNGAPAGFDNCCEDEDGNTMSHIIHAESNAITKLARSTENGEGAVMYCTTAPCIDCAKLIAQAGLVAVYYLESYKRIDGLTHLTNCGVAVHQLTT